MNLKDLLDYRSKCLICGRKMIYRNTEIAGMAVHRNKYGLRIEVDYARMDFAQFNYDGSYERGKHGIWDMYTQPTEVYKICPVCVEEPHPPMKMKPRSVGFTTQATLENIGKMSCVYSFNLYSNGDTHTGNMKHETLSFNDGKKFCHIFTNFVENQTTIYQGQFSFSINDVMELKVPAINLASIKSKDKLINKIKTYNVFS